MLKKPIMRQFPSMRHPTCDQSMGRNLVVTTWPSIRP